MKFLQVRHATSILTYAGIRILFNLNSIADYLVNV